MRYGYARVSSTDQDTAIQLAALRRAGVRRIVQEKASGASSRPVLASLIQRLRPGDSLVVYRVDRLSRSLVDLLELLRLLEARGATFQSLTEPIETGTPTGRLLLQLLGALAEFERQIIRERCAAGVREYLSRGGKWGRPRRLDWQRIAELDAHGLNPCEIARQVGAHHTGVRYVLRSLAKAGHER